MLCKSFEELSHQEKVQFIGKLCHACQSSDNLFKAGMEIIFDATDLGYFDNIKIAPEDGEEENITYTTT